MCLVAPGGKPETWAQKSMSSTSGHIIHLMPGDHTYATPEIPMVIIWNGLNHYCPTYPSNWDDIINWKLTLVNKHISEAISIFGEVEGDLDDAHDFPLCEQFHSLRDTAVNAQKMLTSASVHINKVVIPEPHIGPDPRDIMTSLTRTTNLAKHPVPTVKGFMSERLESIVDVAEATNPAVPLVPKFTSAPTQQTQTHSRPIPTPREIPPVVPVSKPCPTPVTRPGATPVSKPGPTPVTRPGPTPVSKPGPTPVRKPGTTPVGKPGGSGGARPKGSTPFIFLTPKGPAPKPKPRQHTVPSIVVTIPLPIDMTPPQPPQVQAPSNPVTSSCPPLTSSVPASSLAQHLVQGLASSVVSSVVGKGKSARERGKGKGPLKFDCVQPGCSYSTYNKGDFQIHMDKHFGITYKCGQCHKPFGSTKSRDNHIRTIHLKQPRANCPQPDCDFSHNDHGVTRVHLYTSHGIGQEPKCRHPDCADRDLFTNYRVYERHIKTFHIPKDQTCPHCGKKYKGADRLGTHIKEAHSQKVTLQCDECGRFFASQNSLRTHKTHQHK